MKVYFNRKIVNSSWGGGNNFVKNMSEYLLSHGHEVVYDLEEGIDVLFMIDPRPSQHGCSINEIINYKMRNKRALLVHRINECDKRKNTNFMDNILIKSNLYADVTIFISEWLKDYFTNLGMDTEKSHVVFNGCDSKVFFPEKEYMDKTIANKKCINLVTHHWSSNWLKGFDIYKNIDQYLEKNEDFKFTYIGRYSELYKPNNTEIIPPMFGDPLGKELRRHDIYVTASRFEPCGMHHIEGASSGLPVLYHKDGGGINDMCKNHGLEYSCFEEMVEKLNYIKLNYSKFLNKIDLKNISAEYCSKLYLNILLLEMEKLK